MPIQILPPAPAAQVAPINGHSDDEDDFRDYDGDVDMEGIIRGGKRTRLGRNIVTPGELVTDDPQWMRYSNVPQYTIPT